jgi:uncharacterized repeat protein (TIGR02543 family)
LALLLNLAVCYANPVDVEKEKSDFLALINQYRQANGKAPLKISGALTTAAQLHSQDMADRNYFNHTSLDGRTFVDRIRAAGYAYNTYIGENIAAGYFAAQGVFDGWKSSPGHNANMLNPNYVVIGIGIAENDGSKYKIYWTTDFGGYDDSGSGSPPPSNDPPGVPATPSGPSMGFPGTSYGFSTNSTDPDGDQLKLTFDWGDGTSSTMGLMPSSSTGALNHTWGRQGTYSVKAKATDSKGAHSDWSPALPIMIQNRAPNTPSAPSGPATGYTSTSYAFTTSATDPDGNPLRYTFDWGDGTTATTDYVASGSTASASHSWGQPGAHSIKVMATDIDGAGSGWSSPATIELENAPPSTPAPPSGTTYCEPNRSYEYRVYALDPDGEDVRCVFDWGDGTTTETPMMSSGSTFRANHTWSGLGTFPIKARAIDSAGKESSWSQNALVVVKFTSTTTVSIAFNTLARGESLSVNGTIAPPHAGTIALSYVKPDGSVITWQVQSDLSGNYRDAMAPDTIGAWVVSASWGGDGDHFGSSSAQMRFQVDPALCVITFESNATGATALVDGLNCSLPQSFKWLEGTAHTVAVEEERSLPGVKYVFTKWGDECDDLTRDIVIAGPTTYRAIYVALYLVSTKTQPNSAYSESWCADGTVIHLAVNSTIVTQAQGSRLIFTGWSNDATSPGINVTVNGPMAVEALWKAQFLLRVNSLYGRTEGGGWHDEGSEVPLSVYPSIVDCGNGTRRAFELWIGEGTGSLSGEEPNGTLTFSGPTNETATWRTQYLITLHSAHGRPLGAGWYDALSPAHISIEPVIYESGTTRFTFQRWNVSADGRDANATLIVDSPISLEAIWQKEFYLNVSSTYGEAWGSGWYGEGMTASFGVIPPPPNLIGYVFDGWAGGGTAQTINATALMDGPRNVVAKWHRDYTQVTLLSATGAVGATILLYRRRHGMSGKRDNTS